MRVEGRLKMLGEGQTIQQGWIRRSIVEIGDREIRNLQYSPYLSNYIENVGDDVALGVQSILGGKTVYAVATPDGRVRRESVLWPLVILAIYAMIAAVSASGVHYDLSFFWLPLGLMAWLSIAPIKALVLIRTFAPMAQNAPATQERRTA